jgi:putative addiction module component (TIGR02574 family)
MTDATKQVFDQALALSLKERADLAMRIIASLDGPADPDAQAAWAKEIERRAREAQSEDWQGEPWEKVREEIRQELRSK